MSCKFSPKEDNLHETPKPIFLEKSGKKTTYFKMLSAEISSSMLSGKDKVISRIASSIAKVVHDRSIFILHFLPLRALLRLRTFQLFRPLPLYMLGHNHHSHGKYLGCYHSNQGSNHIRNAPWRGKLQHRVCIDGSSNWACESYG